MKRLLLIRHANAEFIHQGITDFQRNLSEKGIADAHKIAGYLLENNIQPQLIIASSANRTLQTARIFANILKYPSNNIIENPELYKNYTTHYFLELLAEKGADKETIAVVAHNPEIEYLAFNLADDFFEVMTPCTVVMLEFDVDSWSDIEARMGNVVLLKYPEK